MLKLYSYEANTIEDAYQKCLQEFHYKEENLYIRTYEKGKTGFFKSKKYVVEVIEKKQIEEYLKNYIEQLQNFLKLEIEYEIKEEQEVWKVKLNSNYNAILIGKDGKTVNAIQTILKQSLKNLSTFPIKIIIDVAEYKENKQKQLEKTIEKIIEEVETTKMSIKLDPMTSYERHIVHNIASKYKNVKTHSESEEPNRYIIIEYEENQ